MSTLIVRHRTTYRYRQPVSFGPHRLMLRPRESRDLHLMSCDITVSPSVKVSWAQDVFGNAVATTSMGAMADTLAVEAISHVRLEAAAWPVFDIAASAQTY